MYKSFFILPEEENNNYYFLNDFIKNKKYNITKLLVNKNNLVEQIIFEISNQLEINYIILIDYKSYLYNTKEILDRIYYHFPKVSFLLLSNMKDIKNNNFISFKGKLKKINSNELEKIFSNKNKIENNEISEILVSNMTKFEKLQSSFTEFSEFKFSGPLPVTKLLKEETVEYILSKKRKKAKVLLIIPSQENVYGTKIMPAYPSLGLMSIGAMLEKAGHYVEIIDLDVDNIGIKEIINIININSFNIIGITSVTSTYTYAINIATKIKEKYKDIPIILGGIHATVNSIECIKEKVFDFVVVGEGECTIVELIDKILGKNKDYSKVKGIIYKNKKGKIISNPIRKLIPNLDDYPLPARHLVKNLDKYSPPDATYLPVAPIMVSRGCPGQCTYCETKNIFGRRPRFRSPENVIKEIRILVNKYNIKEIHFLDDVLTVNRPFIFKFCELLKKEPYKIRFEVANGLRADMVKEDILIALKEVGLGSVGFGVETGSDRVLKIIKKGINKDQVRKAIKISKELGYDVWAFFIIGLPGDDEQSIKETINFAIELNPKYAKFLILKPFPGSAVYYQLEEKGLIDDYDYKNYGVYTAPVHHLPKLSSKRILELQKYAWRKFYLRPTKIFEMIIGVNSLGKFISLIKGGLFVFKKILLKD